MQEGRETTRALLIFCILEAEFERELQGPRRADLVQAAEASIGASAAEAGSESLRRNAKVRVNGSVAGQDVASVVDSHVAEKGMVEDVESFGAEEQVDAFSNGEIAAKGHVLLPDVEAAKRVACKIALAEAAGWHAEGCGIDDLSARGGRLVEIERHAGNNVRTLIGRSLVPYQTVGEDARCNGDGRGAI